MARPDVVNYKAVPLTAQLVNDMNNACFEALYGRRDQERREAVQGEDAVTRITRSSSAAPRHPAMSGRGRLRSAVAQSLALRHTCTPARPVRRGR